MDETLFDEINDSPGEIFDLIEQDINNAIWLGLIKDRDLMEGELSVELKIHR